MAYTTGNSILAKLPPLQGKEVVLVDNQDVNDIIKGVMDYHKIYVDHYNQIWEQFYDQDLNKVCKALFKFCKDYVPYDVESDKFQTVRSPAAIIALSEIWGADCKHYASFIGGVLDAIQRNTGEHINWKYRFASYDWWELTPEHVFVVVNPGKKNEIWIDPVLDSFDQRYPNPKHIYDKKVKMALVSISGINQQQARIGIVPVVAAALIAAIPSLTASLFKIFGKSEIESTGVRTLVSLFRNNVVGTISSINQAATNVTTQEADKAQAWFSLVLGVPIYDIYRWWSLAGLATQPMFLYKNRGTGEQIYISILSVPPDRPFDFAHPDSWVWDVIKNINPGDPINNTDADRIANYKAAAGADANNVSDAKILEAVQIAKNMQSISGVGTWKNLTTAPSAISEELIAAYNAANPSNPITMPTTSGTSISDVIKANPMVTAGVVAIAGWGIYEMAKPKKVSGMNNKNTMLYVGLGAAAVYLLSRRTTTVQQAPVYQPTPIQTTTTTGQANVWSFLDSLASLASTIFTKSGSGSNNSIAQGGYGVV